MHLEADAPRVALAYRVSTKGQVDHDDIPMQKIDCRKFAQKQGWRVVKEVAEKGVSGSKVSASKRDAIQQLKEEAANGEFDILLVYMFDRLGRIESETPFVLEWFVQHGIQMWSTHEGQQKIETHGDKLMNYIRFWQAAGESEKTSIRTRDRIRQIVSSGHYTGGFVCYGYKLEDQGRRNKRDKPVMDLVINEEEATWVRELFYKVIQEGASGYALAEMLNNRGLRTRAGAKFQSSNIIRIIRHEGYTGYIITKNARSEYIPELRIIDRETFDKANDIINLSELDDGVKLNLERMDLYEAAKNCVKNLEVAAAKNNVKLMLLGTSAYINADRAMMDEVLYNLCDNAIRYNRPGGKVQLITSCTRDGHCTLTVKDNGIGIPKDAQSSVFERFYRVDKSRSKATGGTGLGLAIVKHIARIHNARIKLESEVNVGTTITVVFETAH